MLFEDALLTEKQIRAAIITKAEQLSFDVCKIAVLDALEAVSKAQYLATLQRVWEWGDELCTEHGQLTILRRECPTCWQNLKSMEE